MLLTKGKSVVLASIMLVPSASAFAANGMPASAEEADFADAANLNDAQISGGSTSGLSMRLRPQKRPRKVLPTLSWSSMQMP